MQTPEKHPQEILHLQFTLTEEEYTRFYTMSMEREYGPRRRRTNMIGTLELLLAIGYAAYLWRMRPDAGRPAVILAVILLALGCYSFGYFRWIFPWVVRRGAKEGYEGSAPLKQPMELIFSATGVTYSGADGTHSHSWQEFDRIVRTQQLYLLELKNGMTLLLPERAAEQERHLFEELLQTVCDKYGWTLETTY